MFGVQALVIAEQKGWMERREVVWKLQHVVVEQGTCLFVVAFVIGCAQQVCVCAWQPHTPLFSFALDHASALVKFAGHKRLYGRDLVGNVPCAEVTAAKDGT